MNSGTSMAAPHVTGAAAFLMRQDEGKEAEEIRKILDASGNPVGEAEAYGYGLLDVEYAQELLEDGGAALEGFSARTDAREKTPVREKEDVQTFEEVDYVEGRWDGNNHEGIMEEGARKYGGFTETQIKLLKAGAVYPDKALGGFLVYPEWHGTKGKNYVANYIFATQIAKNAGDTKNLPKVMGQGSLCYDRMKTVISTSGILWSPDVRPEDNKLAGRESWGTIIRRETGLVYSEQTADLKEKWRKYFLYGMAAHTITDAFAHSSFYRDAAGNYIEIKHGAGGAHKTDFYENRIHCAANSAYLVAIRSQNKTVGSVMDFSSYGTNYWNSFYLKNILNYAMESNIESLGQLYLHQIFSNINC